MNEYFVEMDHSQKNKKKFNPAALKAQKEARDRVKVAQKEARDRGVFEERPIYHNLKASGDSG